MNKNELPNKIFLPVVKVGDATDCAQFKDEKGFFHFVAFTSQESAMAWLKEGGRDLWTAAWSQLSAMSQKRLRVGSVSVEPENTEEFIRRFSSFGAMFLDLEPNQGKLFAPVDRQFKFEPQR